MRSIPLSFVATLTSGQRPAPDELDVREERSMPVVQHGRVFTRGPAPLNPYTIQLERYYKPLLSEPATSGSEGDGRALSRMTSLGLHPTGRHRHPRRARGFSSPG